MSKHVFYAYVPEPVLCVLEDTEISNSAWWIQGLSAPETERSVGADSSLLEKALNYSVTHSARLDDWI